MVEPLLRPLGITRSHYQTTRKDRQRISEHESRVIYDLADRESIGKPGYDRCEKHQNWDSLSRDPCTNASNECTLTAIYSFLLLRLRSIFRTYKTAISYIAGGTDPTNTTDGGSQRVPISICFRPTCEIITRYHTSSRPSKNKQSRKGLLFTRSN